MLYIFLVICISYVISDLVICISYVISDLVISRSVLDVLCS